MRLPEPIRRALLRWAEWYAGRRQPDNPIGGDYLLRWYVTPWRRWGDTNSPSRLRRFWAALPNVYLHRFGRSDYDRALHDHPWPSVSIVLSGGYYEYVPAAPDVEHSPVVCEWHPPGTVTCRRSTDAHRIEIPEGLDWPTTIFVTGIRRREWGFWCREGWRPFDEWTDRGGCD